MFKRKQKPRQQLTTPPNFLDLRNIAKDSATVRERPRIFSDISLPLAQRKFALASEVPARVGAVAAVCVVVALLLTFTHGRPQNPLSATALAAFKAPSYYPTYLPKGYTLQAATVTGGALTFIASNEASSQSLFFSEQAKQPSFDLKSYYQNQIPDQTGFPTSYGDAVVGHFLNISPLQKEHLGNTNTQPTAAVGSLNTTRTWVLITAPKDFNLDILKKIVLGLRA